MKNLKTIRLLLCVFLLIIGKSISQDLPKIVPPSPVAYELGKFGKFNVGNFTGTLKKSIPLMSYDANKIKVPIFLSYGSNGLKVDQLTSNVGLGWNLISGGVISRTVKGLPDEERAIEIPYNVSYGNPLSEEAVDYYYRLVRDGVSYDSEIDIFSYNFLGRSGRFVLDKNKQPVLLEASGLKVLPSSDFTEFKLIDESGVIYSFSEIELSKFRSHGNGYDVWSIEGKTAWYLTKIEHPFGEEIYLNYKRINYSYNLGVNQQFTLNPFQTGCQPVGFSIKKSIPSTNVGEYNTVILDEISSNLSSSGIIKFDYTKQYDLQVNYLVKSVKLYDKDLKLINNINFQYLKTNNNRTFLKSLKFKNQDNSYHFFYENPELLPSRLSYSQDHWGYFNGKSNIDFFANPSITSSVTIEPLKSHNVGADKSIDVNYSKIGLLKQIIYPTKGESSFEYEGNTYFDKIVVNPDTQLERLEANTSGNESSKTVNFILSDININQKILLNNKSIQYDSDAANCFGEIFHHTKADVRVFNLTTNEYVDIFNEGGGTSINIGQTLSFSPNQMFPNAFVSLKANNSYKLSLSLTSSCLAGELSFEYVKGQASEVSKNVNVGGVRIKRIINYNGNEEVNINRYYYGNIQSLNVSSAIKGKSPKYDKIYLSRKPCPGDSNNDIPNDYSDYVKYVMSSSSVENLFYSDDVNSNSYKYVTVSYGGDDFENGGEEFEYITSLASFGEIVYGDNIQGSVRNNRNWDNGLLRKHSTYKKEGNQLMKISEEVNSYKLDERINDIVYGFTIRKKFDLLTYYASPNLLNIENLDIMRNNYRTNWSYLSKKVSTKYNYESDINFVTEEEFSYGNKNHFQITKTKTKNSNDDVLIFNKKYPHDFNNPINDKLINQNRISSPIQTESYLDKNNNGVGESSELISLQRTNYDIEHNLVLPREVQAVKGVVSASNPLKSRITYHNYDAKGNPIEVSKEDGAHIVYVWGYNKQYPIAKIENAKIVDLPPNVITNLETLSNLDDDRTKDDLGKEGNLRSALNSLRTLVSLENAMITTYTYDPLIGVTSVTDPKGYTIYYEYDEFNRLQYVKDASGKLVSENKYHYKNQTN